MVKFQEDNIMKKYILFTLSLFSYFFQSQIKLQDKSIDSIIIKKSCQCFDFKLDKTISSVTFEEISKDETVTLNKIKVFLFENDKINRMINSKIEYGYFIIYNYKFTIDGSIFYDVSFRYETSKYDKSSINTKIDYINSVCQKIKKGKFISPKKAENIAMQKGMNIIDYQSIDDFYYGTKKNGVKSIKKNVWIFKEKIKQQTRTLVLSAKNGKILADYRQ